MKYHGFTVMLTPVEQNGMCYISIKADINQANECTILGTVWEGHIPLDDSILVGEDVDTWIGDKLAWISLAFTREMMFSRATGQGPLTPKPLTRKQD